MGSDDIFKRRRNKDRQRKHGLKKTKPNSYLIITEGEKTEPLYFKGLTDHIKNELDGNMDVIPLVDIEGKGFNTESLIRETEKHVNRSNVLYENVWVVFDKDDFDNFDDAISLAKEKGYKVAWSNQCFEYWIHLHFEYIESALHRKITFKKLDDIFKKYSIGNGKYRKNYANIYEMLNEYDRVEYAIKHAKSRMKNFDESKTKPSEYDPGTTVYKLVEELKNYLN